jgi:large subunit ribosomal protein L29
VKPAEMREQTVQELAEQEQNLRRELWKTKMHNYTNQLDDTAKIRRLRRDIARIKTVLTERANEKPAKAKKAAKAKAAKPAKTAKKASKKTKSED